MQPWTDDLQAIALGLAIIATIAAVFVVVPAIASERRARRDSRRYALGPDRRS
jgi:cell division protein FtsX